MSASAQFDVPKRKARQLTVGNELLRGRSKGWRKVGPDELDMTGHIGTRILESLGPQTEGTSSRPERTARSPRGRGWTGQLTS